MRIALWIAAALVAVGGSFASAQAADSNLTAADRRALIAEAGYEADSSGKVENVCGEMVSPEFVPADIGGSVGVAELVVIPNGPNSADCYGEGPGDMYLMRRTARGFHTVFADSGPIAILSSTGTDDVHDIAVSGRGDGIPVFRWDGDDYVSAGRNVSRREYDASPAVP
jgi:hypothetical protein